MIICLDISKRTKDELDELVQGGGYRDYSEAIAMAVANQTVLHKRAVAGEVQVVATPDLVSDKDAAEGESLNPASLRVHNGLEIPSQFSYLPFFGSETKGFRFAPYPSDSFVRGQEISADKWIFGQFNKLLPVKATCRAMARLMTMPSSGGEFALPKLASKIASHAAKLGDYLRQLDESSDIHRDDALSLAFPHTKSANSDKSRLRYANQFVGSLTSQGGIAGLPFELKLINRPAGGSSEITLTEAGWQFAVMRNPIIDDAAISGKFSQQEIDFLLGHIRSRVPSEGFAYKVVLESIAQGACTPDKLDDALETYLPKRDTKPFTRAFLTTQRAGVVSRMIDLGLVQRIRDGLNVTYAATAKTFEFSFANPSHQVA